jgi:hypothetical protein
MKKLLLSLMILAVVGTTSEIKAQCDVAISKVRVQIVSAVPNGSSCDVVVNLSFFLDYNNGATFVYFNSYSAADYAALAISNPLAFACTNASTPAKDAPDAGRLGTSITQAGKSFLDIGLDLSSGHGTLGQTTDITANVLSLYSQDPSVELNTPANSGGFIIEKTFMGGTTDSFSVTGLALTVPIDCAGPFAVETDVWASNANSAGAKAQCYVCGVNQFFNDPNVTANKVCGFPRTYNLGITTVDPVSKNITYKIFIDMDDDSVLTAADSLPIVTSGVIAISSGSGFTTGGPVSLPAPYSNTLPYLTKGYLILVEGPTLSNSIVEYVPEPDGCIVTPVNFKSFTAARNRSNVGLKWETLSEINNAGFTVQRNIGGTWQDIAFVPSQAAGGNSDALLTYTLNDLNPTKGITQYRLRQVDLDGKFKLSDIRAVRGEGQIGKTIVYPNPTNTGNVSIVFEDANVKRDVSVIDMTGKVIKQWRNVTNNNLQVENLPSGVFSVRILAVETGEQVVEKIVVNKR